MTSSEEREERESKTGSTACLRQGEGAGQLSEESSMRAGQCVCVNGRGPDSIQLTLTRI